jgi:conjugal transfer pilus assembly protein TraE
MDLRINQHRLNDLKFQRDVIAGVCAILLGINAVQSLWLFFRHERIVITPPQLSQGFWVEGNRFSPQYLEEMALHYAHFLLDVTEKTILYQGEIVMRYVVPQAYGAFKAKLLEDEKRLKSNHLSTRFAPSDVMISPERLSVEITGELMGYVGDKKISQVRETYRFQFQSQSGRLLIKSFTLVKSDQKTNDEMAKEENE